MLSERTLRRYLLDWCPPQSDAIDHAILAEGASPILDVIEDELIEEYVTGEMSDADRPLFESRFLSSKQRLEIRLSAMLLGRPDVAEGLGLEKKNAAALAESMEVQQLGEQMHILVAAGLPEAPSFLDRPLFALWGLGAGLLLGIGRILWPAARKRFQRLALLFPIDTEIE